MNSKAMKWAVAAWLAAGTAVWAEDVIRVGKTRLAGKIVQMTPLEVTIALPTANEKVPVNRIRWIEYSDEPTPLRKARAAAAAGDYEGAQADLDRVNPDDVVRAEIRQDIEFYQALVAARLATAGKGEIPEAGKLMADFVKAHPQSYHYLEANEVVGDLLVANQQFDRARKYYEQVGKAPWPDCQMRAAVAVGRVLLAENKPQEAMKSFESVLAMKADSELAEAQRVAATLGRARCLAEANQADEAVKIANKVIAAAAEDDVELLAQAYNALGIALKKAGRTQEALFALLRVDTLYSSAAEAHAEALFHLIPVWQDLKKLDRAKETQQALQEQYPSSRWAKAIEK